MDIYLVGGAVRDRLLGLPIKERDYVVVDSNPEEMLDLGYTPVGKDFPVFLHPQSHEEYALARTETKIARGYQGFSFHTGPDITLEEDLSRRDLTINAMAETAEGLVIDPYGGQVDLEQGILRHVSPAFVEDPVRVLRLARFAAQFKHLGFSIAPETLKLATALQRAGELNALVPERVWQETQKALGEAHPEEFFRTLRHCGALAILFPELEALFGIPSQLSPTHYIDSGSHALLSLNNACLVSSDPEIRFAALCHSLGKACLTPNNWPAQNDTATASLIPLQQVCDRYKVSAQYRDIALLTAKYHALIQSAKTLAPEALLALLAATDSLRRPERFLAAVAAAEACLIQPDSTLNLVEFFKPLIKAVKTAKPTATITHKTIPAVKDAMLAARLEALRRVLAV